MARYKYITKIEVLDSDDPLLERGKILWMLGKRVEKQLGRVDQETKNLVFAKVKAVETIHLPYSMTNKQAWAYFDEHIKPKELKAIA